MVAALVLAPVVVAAVLWFPFAYFAAAAALFIAAGSWEWAGLSGRPSPARRGVFAAATVVLLLALLLVARTPGALLASCGVGVAWWGVALLWVVGAQRGRWAMKRVAPWLHWLCGWLTLVPTFCALVLLRESDPQGRWWVLLLLVLVWSADAGAYFAGRRFGRHRLASRLSPGKSWEGVLGGAAACLVIGIGVALGAGDAFATPWVLPALCAGIALISVVGDLLESLFKRQAGVKDSGAFIPGHGGVLDRIDSLCAAAPCFALAVTGLFGDEVLR